MRTSPAHYPGADVVEDVVGHFHLFPGAEACGDSKGPEDEKADRADRGLVNPLSRADFDCQRVVLTLMEDNVQRRRHPNKIAPTASLLDLKQHAIVVSVDLLRIKVLLIEPAAHVANQSRYDIRRARIATQLRSGNLTRLGSSRRSRHQRIPTTQTKTPIRFDILLTLRTRRRRHQTMLIANPGSSDERLRSRCPPWRRLPGRSLVSRDPFHRLLNLPSYRREQIISLFQTEQQIANLSVRASLVNCTFDLEEEQVLLLRAQTCG